MGGDHSNTQFALVALWTGRRYGVPTQAALLRADAHFRATRSAAGTWAYTADAVGSADTSDDLRGHAGTDVRSRGHPRRQASNES